MSADSQRFDADYYRRFYGRRPVHDQRAIGHLVDGVLGFASWWRIPVRSVLDVGAGKGYWGRHLAVVRPRIAYHGIDVSPHACRRYGHELADLATWRTTRRYDLVVCQSVLQYLDDDAATRAIAELGGATRGLLWLEVPTLADRIDAIDPDGTDLDVHWRSARWYRRRLMPHFTQIGGGLWLAKDCPVSLFQLERADR